MVALVRADVLEKAGVPAKVDAVEKVAGDPNDRLPRNKQRIQFGHDPQPADFLRIGWLFS